MKYIPAEKLITEIERLTNQKKKQLERFSAEDYCCSVASSIYCELLGNEEVLSIIKSLQQEQPMPDSTKLIELWHEDKEMLKEKDFRDDPWRLAYNAFMCGFGRGVAVNKQEQPEVEFDFQVFAKEMDAVFNLPKEVTENTEENPLNWEYAIARHFYELGLNARKEE